MRTSTWLTVFTLSAFSTLPAYAGHGGGGGGSSSSSSSSSSSGGHSSSSSSSGSHSSPSSSSSGSSHSSGGGSSSSSGHSYGSATHGGGGNSGSWGGYGGTIRDHRSGGGSGGGGNGRPVSNGHGDGGITLDGGSRGGSGGPTVRDHRTHTTVVDGETVVVEDGGSDFSIGDGGYDSTYDAVGYRSEPYGAWGRASEVPHLALELGTGMRRFSDPLAGQLIGSKTGVESAVTTQLRFLVHMSGPFYLGAEGELGGLVTRTPGAMSDPSLTASSAMMFGGAGIVGAMSRQGNAAFGVELAAGGRSVVYQFEGLGDTTSTSAGTAVVEPRARAQYWVTPFVALGAQAGANVINRGDWMAGAYLSIHTRAFGTD